jgi:methylated-DNA-protein-cysteine methyltransferase-like protein
MQEADFFERVYVLCRLIPYGKVTTYGHIADALGAKVSARMVGWALNKCHTADFAVPAHRVINRNGMLSGKKAFGDPMLMENLLVQEGHHILNDCVLDFQQRLWIPKLHLGIEI